MHKLLKKEKKKPPKKRKEKKCAVKEKMQLLNLTNKKYLNITNI